MKRKINKIYEVSLPSNKKVINATLSYPNCDFYAASDETRSVYIWKSGLSEPCFKLPAHTSPANKLILSTDDSEVYSGLAGGLIVIWDLVKEKPKQNLQSHSTAITAMTNFPHDNSPLSLASASGDGKIKLWDLRSKSQPLSIKGHFSQIDCLDFSPSFDYLASGAQDGVIKLWDIKMNKCVKEFASPEQKSVLCCKFNPCQIKIAYGSKDKTIRYWDLNTLTLESQTPYDRLPIEEIQFDKNGEYLFCATNEALKYWKIEGNKKISLVNMFETGWKTLQSFIYVENKAVFGLSSFSSKLSYYCITYKDLFKKNKGKQVDIMDDITEDLLESKNSTFFNDNSIIQGKQQQKIQNNNNNMQNSNILPPDYLFNSNMNNNNNPNNVRKMSNVGISMFMNNNTSISNLSISNDQPQMTGNESIFIKNAKNLISNKNTKGFKDNSILKPERNSNNNNFLVTSLPQTPTQITGSPDIDNFLCQNKSTQMNLTTISDINANNNSVSRDINFDNFTSNTIKNDFININNNDISRIESDNKQNDNDSFIEEAILNIDSEISNKESKDLITTESSFKSFNSNGTMGIDFNKLMQESTQMDQTIHTISQTVDLPILQGIISNHDKIRQKYTKRYNSLEMVAKYWKQSNISSTINSLSLMKDTALFNDFFRYAIIARSDIAKIPFTLDHYIQLLPHVLDLINSNYEEYGKTGCRAGLVFLTLVNDKISFTKGGVRAREFGEQLDTIVQDRVVKCDQIIDMFKKIYDSKGLKTLSKKERKPEIKEFACQLKTDLEFFLRPYIPYNINN